MEQNKGKNKTTKCPECDSIISFKELPTLDDLVMCVNCKTKFEVVSLFPLQLDWLFEGVTYAYDRQFRKVRSA